jgi:hypothetical protein
MMLRAPRACGVCGCDSVDGVDAEALLTVVVFPVFDRMIASGKAMVLNKKLRATSAILAIGSHGPHMGPWLTRSVCSHVPFSHTLIIAPNTCSHVPFAHTFLFATWPPSWAHVGPSWPIGHMAPIWGFHLPIGPYGALVGLGLYGALMGPYATWAHKTKHTVVGDLNGQDFFGAHVGHGPMIAPYTAMWYMGQ